MRPLRLRSLKQIKQSIFDAHKESKSEERRNLDDAGSFRKLNSVFFSAKRFELEQKLAKYHIQIPGLRNSSKSNYNFKPVDFKTIENNRFPVFSNRYIKSSEKKKKTTRYSFGGVHSSRDYFVH